MIVVWRVNTHCNQGCGFCAYARDVAQSRHAVEPERVLRFAAVLARHRVESGERVMLSWLGGEPLLWKPQRELTERIAGLGLDVSATTNGAALAQESTRAHVARHYRELTVSVDGLRDKHDTLRGAPGSFAQLARDVPALAVTRRASGTGPRLRINTVLMRGSVASFDTFCHDVADWGIDEITFNQLGGNDRPDFHREHSLRVSDLETLATRLPALRASLAQRGVRLAGTPGYLARLFASARGERMVVNDCAPGERFLFVDERGRAAPCSYTAADYGVPVESIDSTAALRGLPARFRAARQQRSSAWCANCPSTQWFGKFAA